MIIPIKAKTYRAKQGDLGYYDTYRKTLDIYYNSQMNMDVNAPILIKDFEMPEEVTKLTLIDVNTDQFTLAVPVETFKNAYVDGEGYKFDYEDWKKKYRKNR